MRNLHRIMGSAFVNEKPNLCPTCKHRLEGDYNGFGQACNAKSKIISAAKWRKAKPGETPTINGRYVEVQGRCKDYESVQP